MFIIYYQNIARHLFVTFFGKKYISNYIYIRYFTEKCILYLQTQVQSMHTTIVWFSIFCSTGTMYKHCWVKLERNPLKEEQHCLTLIHQSWIQLWVLGRCQGIFSLTMLTRLVQGRQHSMYGYVSQVKKKYITKKKNELKSKFKKWKFIQTVKIERYKLIEEVKQLSYS